MVEYRLDNNKCVLIVESNHNYIYDFGQFTCTVDHHDFLDNSTIVMYNNHYLKLSIPQNNAYNW